MGMIFKELSWSLGVEMGWTLQSKGHTGGTAQAGMS